VGLTTPHRKNLSCYKMFQSASDLDCFFYESRIFFDKLIDNQLFK